MLSRRDVALAALHSRLAAAKADSSLLLTDEALRDAAELAATTDTTVDPSAAQALGWFHWNRHLSMPDGDSDLAAAVRYFASIYETSPASVPAPIQQTIRSQKRGSAKSDADAAITSNQAARLFGVYQNSGELAALIDAIALSRRAIAAALDGDPNRAAYLSNLGAALQTLSGRTGDTETLTEAIHVTRQAVAATPDGDLNRAMYLSNLGGSLQQLFERTGDIATLIEAVQAGRDAVAATADGDLNRAMYLSNLVIALQQLFDRTGDVAALIEAVQAGRDAVAATSDGDPDRAMRLGMLGGSLQSLSEGMGDTETLTEAIRVTRQAVAAAPGSDPKRAGYLNNLGKALQTLSGRTGDVAALIEAVQAGRAATVATPDGDPKRAMRLENLAGSLRRLFDRSGDVAALIDAVQAGRDAVAATPDGDPDRVMRLRNLEGFLQTLFLRTGDTETLVEAISVLRQAVAATADSDPDRAMYLSDLGRSLRRLFERTGDVAALVEAVQAGRDAVAATTEGDSKRAGYLSDLGGSLQTLFAHNGDSETLIEAIEIAGQAVATVSDSDPDRSMGLGNLGGSFLRAFERTGDTYALAAATEITREAVATASDTDPDRAVYLSNLAAALQLVFRRTGDTETLTEAVQAGRDAVAATPDGDPDRGVYLSNLATALQTLFEHTGHWETLTEAVQAGRDAVAATPDSDPRRAVYLHNLGNNLQTLFEHTGRRETLTEAIVCFQAAGGSTTAAAPIRIKGWRQAAIVLAGLGGEAAQEALAAVEAAVGLLPQLTPRWLIRDDREYQLGEIGFLSGVAAAAAIAAGQPERAVELLEQTRGVLVADTVDARSSDHTRLREAAPELAEAFEELQARIDALDQAAATPSDDPATSDTRQESGQARKRARVLVNARRETQTAWNQLITRIRDMEGFADYLDAPSIRKLAAQAHDGPIVFVSASPTRCDALILTDNPHTPVRLVPLTALTEASAVDQANRLLEARRNATNPLREPLSRIAAQAQILDILAWIWDTITKPVLTALGHTTTPSNEESWPRVWWSPVGVLAYLPLHAAGHHRDLSANDPALRANPRTTLDRAISSYTTTVRSLAYARAHPHTDNDQAVIVAVPDAPGMPPLPGVTAETTTLKRLLLDALVLTNPTRDDVLATLPDHRVAHFACHGHANWNDPARSRLILRDHHSAPLTVADISALRLTGGLAYLSACDTTITSQRLADEAVHIAGAFHLAGYRHVIGTLWSINDALSNDITDDFYADLTAGGKTQPDISRSAQALHLATRRLRARYPQTPTLWAAHTHTGP